MTVTFSYRRLCLVTLFFFYHLTVLFSASLYDMITAVIIPLYTFCSDILKQSKFLNEGAKGEGFSDVFTHTKCCNAVVVYFVHASSMQNLLICIGGLKSYTDKVSSTARV